MATGKSTTALTQRLVKPVISADLSDARRNVLKIYKQFQKELPGYWWDYMLQDIPLPVFKEVIKNQFTKNAHLQDPRVIDRKVEEARQHLISLKFYFYNEYHVRNYLFAENIEPKAKDFLSKFLQGKE